jgi:hypothetical protein
LKQKYKLRFILWKWQAIGQPEEEQLVEDEEEGQ